MRSWGVVRSYPVFHLARYDAAVLRGTGLRAKPLWSTTTERWEVCVSPDSEVEFAEWLLKKGIADQERFEESLPETEGEESEPWA